MDWIFIEKDKKDICFNINKIRILEIPVITVLCVQKDF